MTDSRTEDQSYFKRGARIKPDIRRRLAIAATPLATRTDSSVRGEAYQIAMASLHKSWARRWLKENRYV